MTSFLGGEDNGGMKLWHVLVGVGGLMVAGMVAFVAADSRGWFNVVRPSATGAAAPRS